MSVTRLAAPRFTIAAILLSASWAGQVSAQSAATSGEQWRSAGVTRPTNVQPAASLNSSPAWRLPNGQQPADAVQSSGDESNPLRQKEKPKPSTASAAEPQTFQPPSNAKRITTAQSTATSQSQQRNQSAAAAMAPIAVASVPAKQANLQQRTAPVNRAIAPQRPAYQRRPMQANNVRRAAIESPTDSLWQTINVAFQGEAAAPAKTAPVNKRAPKTSRCPATATSRCKIRSCTISMAPAPSSVPISPTASPANATTAAAAMVAATPPADVVAPAAIPAAAANPVAIASPAAVVKIAKRICFASVPAMMNRVTRFASAGQSGRK